VTDDLRVALVHERFSELGGSERVVEQLHAQWPTATVHAPIADRRAVPDGLRGVEIHTSPLQRVYRGGPRYSHLLPVLPMAVRHLDVGAVDVVITSHHAFANRVTCPPGAVMVSYTHTPGRWMWDPAYRHQELEGLAGRAALAGLSAALRRSDKRAAQRPDVVVANSRFVAARIDRWWNRRAVVVPPPVNTRFHHPADVEREDFFLLAGRLVAYKRPMVAIRAAERAGVRLVVAGGGRELPAVRKQASDLVSFLGPVDDEQLRELYQRCRGLVFPGVEDFGIVPVEAQSCGAPVVARAEGGVLDSVLPEVTGVLYEARDGHDETELLASALRGFAPAAFDPEVIRSHAEEFSEACFRSRMATVVAEAVSAHR
jgi:glycosyltransferase involved in cell wall biosynthesis